MKLTPLCVSHIFQRRALELENLRELGEPEKMSAYRSIIESMVIYIGPDIEPTEIMSVAYRVAKKTANIDGLYSSLLSAAYKVAKSRAESIRDSVSGMEFRQALTLLLRASALSSGYRVLPDPHRVIEEPPSYMDVVNAKLGVDDTEKIVSAFADRSRFEGGSVYYVFGSVPELPYDAVLIELLREELGVEVVGVVRVNRFEDQATVSDLEEYNIVGVLDDVIAVSSDTPLLGEESKQLLRILDTGSLVVLKGDYGAIVAEAVEFNTAVVLLFSSNCPVISSVYAVEPGTVNIIAKGRGLG